MSHFIFSIFFRHFIFVFHSVTSC
ncbi:hypothetical protein Gotri_023709 [Gossypium trilobum]|uniref:Uncharacterized protein n=1 Tax=Gossypium trilobum TaxID=34281 RepID=A0A7J9DJV5_9ROSI|nr:hypothetical protein [Gossypium trilobum]